MRQTTLLLSLTSFFAVFLLYVSVNWMPGVMRGEGYALKDSLLAIGLFNAGGITGAISTGVLIDRLGPFESRSPSGSICWPDSVSRVWHCRIRRSLSISCRRWPAGSRPIPAVCAWERSPSFCFLPIFMPAAADGTLGVGRFGAALGPLLISVLLARGLIPRHLSFFLPRGRPYSQAFVS